MGWSYQNLVSHVQTAHPDYFEVLNSGGGLSQTHLEKYFATSKSNSIYRWVDFDVTGLLPFSFVEKQVVKPRIRHAPFRIPTLMKYTSSLAEEVEQKIFELLLPNMPLVFDGWSQYLTHYLAVYASYASKNVNGFETRLLTISPMGDEITLNAKEHQQFLTCTLDLYGKSCENIVALIGDDISTNNSLSKLFEIPLVGCASRSFNLSVRNMLNVEQELWYKIHKVMSKLRALLLSAKFRKLTELLQKVSNKTRWSSAFEMMKRNVDI